MKERIYQTTIIVLTVMLFSVWQAYAGNPAGPGTPPASTYSYTLEDIYNRLNNGTAGSQSTFTEPSVAPGTGTMYTLNEIMAVAPMTDTNGATTTDVLTGTTFWGLTEGEWALQTGTAPPAGVPDTRQTVCYDPADTTNPIDTIPCIGSGQDGAYTDTVGVDWPNPRFTDNSDGTVTDNLTGLIWLKNTNCADATRTWATALSDVTQLNTDGTMNSNDCGDTSNGGSHQTDWRLPNVRELQSLLHYGFYDPVLPNTAGTGQWAAGDPFTGVEVEDPYWSSSTYPANTAYGWNVSLYDGYVRAFHKTSTLYVWPVRGGQ